MADNNTWGRISTMKGGGVQGFYDEAKKALADKWKGTKEALGTLKDATGIGVSDEVASAARDKIGQGVVDSVKGMATLTGPSAEDVQAAYMSGNQEAIDAVTAAQQAQMQAATAIKNNVQKAVTDSYGRNGVMGVLGMATATVGAEVVGQKGAGLATHAAADAVEAAAEAAKVEKLAKAVIKDEGIFVKMKGMAQFVVNCFKAGKKTQGKIPEYDRQLAGQEKGINDMTVQQYLDGRAAFDPANRSSSVAESARLAYSNKLTVNNEAALFAAGIDGEEALSQAQAMTKETMNTLAALHNPDMIAGGVDVISDFGDRGVNSSIGGQWKDRIGDLDKAAEQVPESERVSAKMNVKLVRCP